MIECGLNEDMEKKADEAYKKFEVKIFLANQKSDLGLEMGFE